MEKIFINAGAGSGKTYTITNQVADLVKEGLLKPEQVIMTTYTKAAAQELREKTKNELCMRGLLKEAQQMEHALIGTVHAVANTFLTKYWYMLGIMPDAAAMEDDEVVAYRDHSLRGLLEKEDRIFFYRYAEDYNITFNDKGGINYEFWKDDLCKVLDYIMWYGINEEQLKKSIDTTESILNCLKPTQKELKDFTTEEFYEEVDQFFGVKAHLTSKQQSTKDFYESLKHKSQVTPEMVDTFKECLKLEFSVQGVKYKLTGPATACLWQYLLDCTTITEKSVKDQQRYADTIFRLAAKWQLMYRNYKDEHHMIDFNDMEEMFLNLLENEEVRQDICSRYTHLFVDEFQDSNPIQVKIFQKLSSMLNTTYVGDKKQAIYGFRGSDTALTTAVADSIANKKKLENSFRSVERLVDFSNQMFTKIFENMDMKDEDVTLTMPKDESKGNRDVVEKPLRLWHYESDQELALQIQQLILKEGIKEKDIAVLARNNKNLDKLAEELQALKVPVCRESSDINESRTGKLMKALLTLANSPYNQMARAEVAYLTQPDYTTTKVIEDRLDYLNEKAASNEYLNEVPLINSLIQLLKFKTDDDDAFPTNLLGFQSISALVETLVIELDLYGMVQNWDNALTEETNLQAIIDLARKYEDVTTKAAKPATITGFISYFTSQEKKGAANEDGVRLFTYHKSKGLEWKVVILLSLDNDATNAGKIATRCMLGCHYHREVQPTVDNMTPAMTISLVHNIYGTSTAAAAAMILERLQNHRFWKQTCFEQMGEDARLLYVGVTRARNILILTSKSNNNVNNLRWFESLGATDVTKELKKVDFNKDDMLTWPEKKPKYTHHLKAKFSRLDNYYFVSPSKAGKTPHEIVTINQTEYRMKTSINEEQEASMGDFIHQVFCCCDDDITEDQINCLRESYNLTEKNISAPQLIESWNFLIDTLEKRYGKCIKKYHERPFRHLDKDGHMVTGFIDLIWETEDGYVVVDYKTCPGNYNLVFKASSEHFAGCHGDQLDCYQRALEALGGKKVKAKVIYYPVTRFVVEVI